MYNLKSKVADSNTRLSFMGPIGIGTPSMFKITNQGKDDEGREKMKIEGGRFTKNPKMPQKEVRYPGKTTTMKDNNYKYSKKENTKYDKPSKQVSKSYPNRMYGIDERDGKPVVINSDYNSTLFVNQFLDGAYSTNALQNANTTNLALNIVRFTPCSINTVTKTKALSNFTSIYDRVLAKVSQQSNASAFNLVTLNNFFTYVNTVSFLVDLFYELDSILAWKPESEYNNEAMKQMKRIIDTPSVLEAKYNLRTFLTTVCIPKPMIDFLNWKNQTYRTSELPNSALMRFCTSSLTSSLVAKDPKALIDSINLNIGLISGLTDTDTSISSRTRAIITGVMHRFVEGWSPIENLPLSCNTSTYDSDFIDVFRNQTVVYGPSANPSSYYPGNTVTDGTRLFATVNDPNRIKDSTLALTGFYGNSILYTGLMNEGADTLSTGWANKYCYTTNGSTYFVTNRNNYEWNFTDDTHCVDISSGDPKTYRFISRVPSDAQLIYYQASKNLDIAVRNFQNSLFIT